MANLPNLALPKFTAERYDSDLAESFLAQYENFITTYDLTPQQSVKTLHSALAGNAAVWLKNLLDASPDITWERAKEAFKTYYTAPVPRAHRAEIAAKCRQRPDEEIRTFLQRCLATANQCIPCPQAGGLASQRITVRVNDHNHQVDYTPTADNARVWTQVYRHETAVNLFIAGCDSAVRNALLLDARWTTWDELCQEATRIQSTVHPESLRSQLRVYTGGAPRHGHVSSLSTQAAPPSSHAPAPPPPSAQLPPPAQAITPLTGGRRGPGSGKGKAKAAGAKGGKPKPAPHPQQQQTHQHPVQCYYCTGTHHTERHCLAKQAAAGLVNPISGPAAAAPALPQLPAPGPLQPPAPLGAVHAGYQPGQAAPIQPILHADFDNNAAVF